MFAKIFALFALLAVAFAAPNPKPQLVTYSAGLDYGYVPAAGVAPSVYSAYSPVAYSAYPAAPTVYVR
uniref:Cuticle protein n=1 Tax=Heliothis virescens TaxID=7102 RepID=A0A2A4JJ53_HELVI